MPDGNPPKEQERSVRTRERLLDATLDVIFEEGWSGASTNRICERAGVSRGAQTHHYPTKVELLLAAIEHASRAHAELIESKTAELGPDAHPLRTFLELVWDAMLDERYSGSWLEALTAARTDPKLRNRIQAADRSIVDGVAAMAAGLAERPEPRAKELFELTVYLMRGLVLQRGVHPETAPGLPLLERWLAFVEQELAHESD